MQGEGEYKWVYIVTCQVHPVLVKKDQVYGLFVFLKFLQVVTVKVAKGSLTPCLVAARVLSLPGALSGSLRPHPAGTRQYKDQIKEGSDQQI